MKITVSLIFLILISACVNHTEIDKTEQSLINAIDSVTVKYAKGFLIDNSNPNYSKIIVNSIHSKHQFSDTIYLSHSSSNDIKGKKVIKPIYNSIALQSSTYLAYLSILNKVKIVKGISGLQYVSSFNLNNQLNINNAIEISNNGSIEMEKLLKINPELFLIFPFELDNQSKYSDKGIQTLLISEYLEKSPLARLEWIKLFGLVFNENDIATSYFNNIEDAYNALKVESNAENTVFFNLPYKDTWNMPNSNSITANLAKNAGYNYIFSDTINDNSIRTTEEVWLKGMNCKYWIIIASKPKDFSLNDLMAESPIYSEFRSVKNGKVIFCNTATTDYFTMGVVEPNIMLKDLIHLINPIDDYKTKYFKILK